MCGGTKTERSCSDIENSYVQRRKHGRDSAGLRSGIMGDTSPKNIHKLAEKKHEDHVKKEEHKHENAETQHLHGQPETEQDETEAKKEP